MSDTAVPTPTDPAEVIRKLNARADALRAAIGEAPMNPYWAIWWIDRMPEGTSTAERQAAWIERRVNEAVAAELNDAHRIRAFLGLEYGVDGGMIAAVRGSADAAGVGADQALVDFLATRIEALEEANARRARIAEFRDRIVEGIKEVGMKAAVRHRRHVRNRNRRKDERAENRDAKQRDQRAKQAKKQQEKDKKQAERDRAAAARIKARQDARVERREKRDQRKADRIAELDARVDAWEERQQEQDDRPRGRIAKSPRRTVIKPTTAEPTPDRPTPSSSVPSSSVPSSTVIVDPAKGVTVLPVVSADVTPASEDLSVSAPAPRPNWIVGIAIDRVAAEIALMDSRPTAETVLPEFANVDHPAFAARFSEDELNEIVDRVRHNMTAESSGTFGQSISEALADVTNQDVYAAALQQLQLESLAPERSEDSRSL